MRKRIVIDGTPDEVKVSCPVWRGGKSGDNVKGLPITIGHHLRRLFAPEQNRGGPLRRPWQPHGALRLRQPGQGEQPVLADDGAPAHDARRIEIHPQGRICGNENRNTSYAH